MTKEEFNAFLQEGIDAAESREHLPFDDVMDEIERQLENEIQD